MRDLGADRFISAEAGRPGQAAGGFDVVIDTVGGAVLDGSYGLLREGARLVTLGASPDQELAGRYKVHAMFFVVKPDETVEMRTVVKGTKIGTELEVEQGLQPGEIVVSDGQLRLAPGMRVQVKK